MPPVATLPLLLAVTVKSAVPGRTTVGEGAGDAVNTMLPGATTVPANPTVAVPPIVASTVRVASGDPVAVDERTTLTVQVASGARTCPMHPSDWMTKDDAPSPDNVAAPMLLVVEPPTFFTVSTAGALCVFTRTVPKSYVG